MAIILRHFTQSGSFWSQLHSGESINFSAREWCLHARWLGVWL